MTYNHLVSVPYTEMKCWDLVAEVLGMYKFKTQTPREQVKLRNILKQQFKEIDPKDIQIHDVVLHGTHVGIVIPGGILHARDPYSEFVPTNLEDLHKGIQAGDNYTKPTFHRRVK